MRYANTIGDGWHDPKLLACGKKRIKNEPRAPWEQRVIGTREAGALYFGLVFAAGFVLGTTRTLWVAPRVGTRTAELMEMPIMLAVTIVAARWTVLRMSVPMMWSARLEMGCIALVLMLVAEFGARALDSGSLDQGVFRYARPCVGISLMPAVHGVCNNASSRGQRLRLLPQGGGANAPAC